MASNSTSDNNINTTADMAIYKSSPVAEKDPDPTSKNERIVMSDFQAEGVKQNFSLLSTAERMRFMGELIDLCDEEELRVVTETVKEKTAEDKQNKAPPTPKITAQDEHDSTSKLKDLHLPAPIIETMDKGE